MNFIPGQEEQATGAAETAPDMGDESASFITSEEKKPQVSRGTLGLGGLLLACGAAMYFMYLKPAPQTASAADAQAASDVDTFLASGEQHVVLMKQMLQNTQGVVDRFKTYPTNTQIPPNALRTNPFRHAPPKDQAQPNESETASRRRKEQERAEALEAVKKLRLQSILNGRVKAAMINGKLVRVGEQVEQFTVEDVTATGVLVRAGEQRFELRMKQ